jgi:hypothetical protein
MDHKVTISITCPAWMSRAARSFLPILAMAVSGVALSSPKTFASGETLTAADLNASFSDLDTRTTALEGTAAQAWQSYPVQLVEREAPHATISGVVKNVGFYRRVGDTIEVRIYTEFNAAPAGGNYLAWTLPAGLSFDTTKLPANSLGYAFRDTLGIAVADDNPGEVATAPDNLVCVPAAAGGAPFNAIGPANGNVALGAGSVVTLSFSVPVTP